MSHQMMITLSDDEYHALQNAATQTGKQIETLVHEALAPHLLSALPSGQAVMEKLYQAGKIMNVPARQPLSQAEMAERERLAQKLGQGKPLSEIVIEERGPKV